jgi:hypothetical protein
MVHTWSCLDLLPQLSLGREEKLHMEYLEYKTNQMLACTDIGCVPLQDVDVHKSPFFYLTLTN